MNNYPYIRRNIKFVGFQNPLDIIPAGTLIRVFLARWWASPNDNERRCYLQLSGWYTRKNHQKPNIKDFPTFEGDDLPF